MAFRNLPNKEVIAYAKKKKLYTNKHFLALAWTDKQFIFNTIDWGDDKKFTVTEMRLINSFASYCMRNEKNFDGFLDTPPLLALFKYAKECTDVIDLIEAVPNLCKNSERFGTLEKAILIWKAANNRTEKQIEL